MIKLLKKEDYSKIFVYTAYMHKFAQKLPTFWEWLCSKEREKARSYYNKLHSENYIISHGILRYILSCYTEVVPQDIVFAYNAYGKPFLERSNIEFNMSHSNTIASYVIAYNHKVGIDIEYHNKAINIAELADLIFTSEESKSFKKILSHNTRIAFFYNLWTKKEAIVKAIGQGLSYPINTLILTQEDEIIFNFSNANRQKLYCYPLKIASNYSGAVAINQKIARIIYSNLDEKHIPLKDLDLYASLCLLN